MYIKHRHVTSNRVREMNFLQLYFKHTKIKVRNKEWGTKNLLFSYSFASLFLWSSNSWCCSLLSQEMCFKIMKVWSILFYNKAFKMKIIFYCDENIHKKIYFAINVAGAIKKFHLKMFILRATSIVNEVITLIKSHLIVKINFTLKSVINETFYSLQIDAVHFYRTHTMSEWKKRDEKVKLI